MNQEDYRLLNFKINPDVKNQFHRLCRSKRSNMTSELNRMIYEFISNNKPASSYQRPLEWLISKGSRNS
jgi:hypothetical protein